MSTYTDVETPKDAGQLLPTHSCLLSAWYSLKVSVSVLMPYRLVSSAEPSLPLILEAVL